MNLDTTLDIAMAIGTVGATLAAVYYGSIRPARRVAKLEIASFRKSDYHSVQANELVGEEGDLLEVGFFVHQKSGSLSSRVSILVKKVWYWEDGEKQEWPHFVPSTLRWAANGDVNFSEGTQRYCYLGFYGDPPANDFVGPVFSLATNENKGDPIWGSHSNLLPNHKGKAEIELILSGENVLPKEVIFELNCYNQNEIGPIGEDGLPSRGSIIDTVDIKLISSKEL